MNAEQKVGIGKLLAIGVIALLGAAMVFGAIFTPKDVQVEAGGIMSITTTRSCDFVTFEGKTYQVCNDGIIGIFTELEQLPFEEPPPVEQ